MAKKPSKQTLKSIEPRRNIATYIGLIMAGLSVGISVTFIFMSQTSPLRENIRELKKQCLELSKENEDLKKTKDFPPSKDLVKENTNLINELNKRNVDYEKLKNQLIQITAENKTLLSKINNIYKDYNRLKKNEDDLAQHYVNEFTKLRMLAKGAPEDKLVTSNKEISKKSEEKDIFVNSTIGFFNNNVFVTLRSLHGKDKISAVVHSSGYQEMTIDNEVAGKTFAYNSNKNYEIRIMSVNPNINNGLARFLISIK